jgi:hypothetical protein
MTGDQDQQITGLSGCVSARAAVVQLSRCLRDREEVTFRCLLRRVAPRQGKDRG